MVDFTEVEVKSAWLSKINWTQVAQIAFSVGALFGLDVPPEEKAAIITAINGIGNVVTIVMKTFFTSTITPASAANS